MNRTVHVFELHKIMSNYGIFKSMIVWRNAACPPKNNYGKGYQPILFFTKSNKYTFNKGADKKPRGKGSFIPNKRAVKYGDEVIVNDFWDDIPFISGGCVASKEAVLQEGSKKKAHPAQMPLRLAERAILISSNKGDLILDPFVGSGTTCIAAKKLGRNYIGIELSEEYCKIAEERLKNTYGNESDWI